MVLIRRQGEKWREPASSTFDNEKALQELVKVSPSLLPGADELAIVAELAVPGIGFVDLVGVGADGQVVIVECKLRANPEIRREVVGQVLSYASGLWRMSYEDFESAFIARSVAPTLCEAVVAATGVEVDETAFRLAVARNLESGSFRLIVAVDTITAELRAIIEYLNDHSSDDVEVLALELAYARDGDVELLSPVIYGQEAAQRKAKGKSSTKWTEATFDAEMQSRLTSREVHLLQRLLAHGVAHGHHSYFGAGTTPGMSYFYEISGQPASVWQLYLYDTGARFALSLGSISKRSSEVAWRFIEDLRSDPLLSSLLTSLVPESFANKQPHLPTARLANDETERVLIGALDRLAAG